MSNYSATIDLQCPADKVFQMVANPENMPKYLPTLNEAHMTGPDKVSMDGEAEGHPYHAEGDLHLDPERRSMTWGSDSNHKYRGELQITGEGESSTLSVRLTFEPGEKMEEAVKAEKPDAQQVIQKSLEESLQSIKRLSEMNSQ